MIIEFGELKIDVIEKVEIPSGVSSFGKVMRLEFDDTRLVDTDLEGLVMRFVSLGLDWSVETNKPTKRSSMNLYGPESVALHKKFNCKCVDEAILWCNPEFTKVFLYRPKKNTWYSVASFKYGEHKTEPKSLIIKPEGKIIQ